MLDTRLCRWTVVACIYAGRHFTERHMQSVCWHEELMVVERLDEQGVRYNLYYLGPLNLVHEQEA